MIIFNEDELKTYLKQKTGYEVSSIYTIDYKDPIYIFGKKSTISVIAYYNATKNPQLYKDLSIRSFLWEETVNIADFIRFLRLQKLHKLNK